MPFGRNVYEVNTVDKYEYKVRADEIKSLIAEGDYAEAVKIADTIDWRRVKSVMMLCTISDLYKINRRYEDSRDILLLAYERHTGGRLIVYSLCELSIKLGEFVQAVEYYKEFVQLAPKDSGRYILQYKLYEAQEVSLEERIEVLEELKKHDYREKWAYELAYLYHRVGLASKCVEECDEMALWFGEGRYVMKALELKMLHEPLTQEQQIKYELMKLNNGSVEPEYVTEQRAVQEEAAQTEAEEEGFSLEENIMAEDTQEIPGGELDIQVKTVDVSQYNTINLQRELAESMREILEDTQAEEVVNEDEMDQTRVFEPVEGLDSDFVLQETLEAQDEAAARAYEEMQEAEELQMSEEMQSAAEQELYLRQDTDEMQLITDADLMQESAEEELFEETAGETAGEAASGTAAQLNLEKTQIYEPIKGFDHPITQAEEPVVQAAREEAEGKSMQSQSEGSEEVFFGNTSEVNVEEVVSELAQKNASKNPFTPILAVDPKDMPMNIGMQDEVPMPVASPDPAISNTGIIRTFNKPSGYDNMLSQEYDGQISLVVPEQEKIEKQITGQISIEDVMAEWERMKQENERKRMEEIRKRVQQQTDTLFADFDESTKTGLLEQLEKNMVAAALKEEKERAVSGRPRVVKVADIEKAEVVKRAAQAAAVAAAEYEEELAEEAEDYVEEMAEEVADLQEEFADEAEEIVDSVPEAAEEEFEEIAEAEEIEETADEESEAEEIDFEIPEIVYEEDSEEEAEESDASAEDEEDVSVEESASEESVQAEVSGQEDDSVKAAEVTGEEETEEVIEAAEADEEAAKAAETAEVAETKALKAEAATHEEVDSKYTAREMTDAEREQFAPFIHHKKTRRQIVEAIDNISMASYTGNVIITGEEGTGTTALAKLLVKEIQLSDDNFSGKVAKISGVTMNKKDVEATLDKLSGGALIIEDATGMKKNTVTQLLKELNQEEKGLVVMMEDSKASMEEFLVKYPELASVFNLRVDVEALDDQTLVKYAKKYAYDQEYTIDDLGVLALHTRIADMQTSDHEVTLAEIEELVDEAIYYADRKTPKHFFDVLFGKRYDEEDMIILREKDFMHY